MMCCSNCPRYLRISRTCMYTFKSNLILGSLILLMCTHAISNSNAAVLDKTLVYCFDASPTGFDANQARSIPEYTTHSSPLYNRLVDSSAERRDLNPASLSDGTFQKTARFTLFICGAERNSIPRRDLSRRASPVLTM